MVLDIAFWPVICVMPIPDESIGDMRDKHRYFIALPMMLKFYSLPSGMLDSYSYNLDNYKLEVPE